MRCREAIYVDESTIDFLFFSYFLIQSFLFFLFSESWVSYFPIFWSDQAAGHPGLRSCVCQQHLLLISARLSLFFAIYILLGVAVKKQILSISQITDILNSTLHLFSRTQLKLVYFLKSIKLNLVNLWLYLFRDLLPFKVNAFSC